jgi:Tfp pilus assembly protein PilZ
VAGPRAHPRYAVEIDAEVRWAGKSQPARTRNVSKGGLAVIASERVPPGADVVLAMSLVFDEQAMSEPLPLHGRVVWCTALPDGRYQLGVTFVALRLEERQYVDMFLRYLTEGQ